MPQLPFQPKPGLFTDTSLFSGNGGWIDGSNVRFWNGRWQVIGGWTSRGLSLSAVNAIHEWKTSAGTSYIAWGADGSLKVETGGVLSTITPGVSSGKWTFANYGETLIANISGGKIYQWNLNTAVAAAQVTNAPVQVTCVLVSRSRQLIAFGCNEEASGTFNPRAIRCSDFEDITDWTTTAANGVEETILDGAASGIVTAHWLGDYVAVWTSNDLWMGQFIGDPSQCWRYTKVGTNCGSISLRGVAVVGSTAYWLTPDLRFMAWSPGSEPTEIACPLINYLRGVFPTSAAKVAVTFACHVAKFNEIWFTFSNDSGQYIGRYVAFSLTDGHWFKGSASRVAMRQGLSGLLGATSAATTLITCESGKQGLTTQGVQLQWSIKSSDICLDSGHRRMMVRSMVMDFSDQAGSEQAGDVSIEISARDYPNSGRVTTTLTATSGTSKKDLRFSGRLINVTFSGSDVDGTTDTFARQGMPVFELVPTGER